MPHHLENKMSGGPKSGQTEILSILETGQSQGPVTDGAGAQQGSRLGIAESTGDVTGKALGQGHILGIAAIDVSARGLEVRAQIFIA